MALTIYHPAFHPAYLLNFVRKSVETEQFAQMVSSIPNGKSGLPLEFVLNSRKYFPENRFSILPQTEISGFFG